MKSLCADVAADERPSVIFQERIHFRKLSLDCDSLVWFPFFLPIKRLPNHVSDQDQGIVLAMMHLKRVCVIESLSPFANPSVVACHSCNCASSC